MKPKTPRVAPRLFAFAALVCLFCLLAANIGNAALISFETAAAGFAEKMTSPALDAFMVSATHAGSLAAVVAVILALIIAKRTRFACGFPAAACLIASSVSNLALKNF
ncbi:MAG: hypothetical protein FWF03_07720, partial [Defluviitaleaceae bacterium]|nr:hypothetical protein [Defluviitaleaceae bacterium]